MENLILLGERRRSLPTAKKGATQHTDTAAIGGNIRDKDTIVDLCRVFADGLDSGLSTVVLTKNGIVTSLSEEGEVVWTCDLQALDGVNGDEDDDGTELEDNGWFDLAYVDPELVCVSRRGAMVTVSPSTGEAELIGVFDYGLEAAAWSPDGEVLLMVTSAADDDDEGKTKSVLMTMNSQFEVLAEIAIPSYLASQVDGSKGDGLRENGVSVTWRPDGTLCAMSAVDAEDGVRKVRVFQRETLQLHAIGRSEDASGTIVKNLQNSGLSWASAGCSQLLAAVQRKGKKTHQVIFFESNGLRHREFSLREKPSTIVTQLAWNVNSDLLAVALREEGGTDKLQLWHRCNYHWYMKQEIQYTGQSIEAVQFNEEKATEFYVLLHGMAWREYEVRWDPSTTFVMPNQCPAMVVDGSTLNITPLDKALIPPPMSMNTLSLEHPIADICFCRGKMCMGSLIMKLSNGDLVYAARGERPASYSVSKLSWHSKGNLDTTSLRSILVVGENAENELNLVAIAPGDVNQECEILVEILVTHLDKAEPKANIINTSILEDRVLRMVNWSDNANGCILHLLDGSLLEYEVGSILPSDAEPFLEPCPWICAIKDATPFAGSHHDGHSKLLFGLSTRSRLYFHDMMLTDSASSFYLSLSHEFLCYATTGSRCFLRFLPLKEINSFDPLMGLDQNHLLEGYEPRSVERGARIVAILSSQPMAVLQMPRGNLEGVYPRALMLRFVMLQIAKGEYGNAFRMMRRHKVDLNLLVDFDPWHFHDDGISSFFKQVTAIDHLNLFLSGLQNWDITQSRFPVPTWLRRENVESRERSSFEFSTKVNQICKRARATMMTMEKSGDRPEGHFLLPILSTFAKESPHKLDEALQLIKERALKQHPQSSKKPPLFADKAQNAIHYLAFLAEYELLFETALGMYDYEIARAVARNSQMDPKIYLPLLKRLNGLPMSYAKYEVDIRLKRFEAALSNLFESYKANEDISEFQPLEANGTNFGNSFEHCMALIETHKLHQLALKFFEADPIKTCTILHSLGESLMIDKKPNAALSVFLAADPPSIDSAKRAARAARDWKMFFSLIAVDSADGDNEVSKDQKESAREVLRQTARDVASEIIAKESDFDLKSNQESHTNAARILLDYGDDLYGAIDMLLQAQCWSEGHRTAMLHSRPDLAKKCFDSCFDYAHQAMDEFDDKVSTFCSSSDRFSEVLKLRKKNVMEEGPISNEVDETGSLFSVASNMSNMSLQSNTSTSSTGSSVSSVISVKTATTFTMTGDDGINRHRSKFNKGKGKKAKKKKKKKVRKKPGSVEEVNSLVFTLKTCCPGSGYATIISETIRFLIFAKQLALATELFERYNSMREAISRAQKDRIETATAEKAEAERQSRVMGEQNHDIQHILLELPVEKDVDALSCAELQVSLTEFFNYLSL